MSLLSLIPGWDDLSLISSASMAALARSAAAVDSSETTFNEVLCAAVAARPAMSGLRPLPLETKVKADTYWSQGISIEHRK
jgi:hypothetical protein